MNAAPLSEPTGDYETLMQFLYRVPIGLVQTALDGQVEMINPMAAALLMPISRDRDLDNFFKVMAEVAPQLCESAAAFAAPSGIITESVLITLPSDLAGGAQVLSVSLLKLDENRLMAALSDVTLQVQREQQRLARRLSDAAHTDSLTQMPNRAAVREQIQHAMARAAAGADGEFAVLFMNCDRLRQINDTLGHRIGDEVLNLMAGRMRASVRPQDRLGRPPAGEPMAARIGGDEFVIVLDGLRRAEDVHSIAQRLLDGLAQPYCIGTEQIHSSVSIGIALQAQASGDADAVLQDASIAMMEAKRAGGARYVVFEAPMHERAVRRGGIEAELRHALTAGELFVVYQPVVCLQGSDDDRPYGVEALVRWAHPTRGVVPPIEFIGVAEECGLIGALGDFVLATACREFVGWQQQLGARAPALLAVNLSRAQLYQPGLVKSVADTLRDCRMHAGQLQLEVTESLAAQDGTVQARLNELKALHLTLALDDFGTGYSSLASLHQLPVDTVKIDRSFVSQADTSQHHRVLIEATVRVASSLGMSTVAEGIETRAQAAVVRRLGCDKGQGYFYSRPLTAADLLRWVDTTSGAAGEPIGRVADQITVRSA